MFPCWFCEEKKKESFLTQYQHFVAFWQLFIQFKSFFEVFLIYYWVVFLRFHEILAEFSILSGCCVGYLLLVPVLLVSLSWEKSLVQYTLTTSGSITQGVVISKLYYWKVKVMIMLLRTL